MLVSVLVFKNQDNSNKFPHSCFKLIYTKEKGGIPWVSKGHIGHDWRELRNPWLLCSMQSHPKCIKIYEIGLHDGPSSYVAFTPLLKKKNTNLLIAMLSKDDFIKYRDNLIQATQTKNQCLHNVQQSCWYLLYLLL